MPPDRTIFLIDGQSFYASCEKVAHPEYRDRPIAVGDPERRSGIILATCPIAKAKGVTTASRVSEALAVCPDLVVIRPRMQRYITISLLITEIFESFTDQVEPYSIDELSWTYQTRLGSMEQLKSSLGKYKNTLNCRQEYGHV
jgi:nucleotidyltransferase/DNA polymerase involved in DNA repair